MSYSILRVCGVEERPTNRLMMTYSPSEPADKGKMFFSSTI
jgi:hypothetical protein